MSSSTVDGDLSKETNKYDVGEAGCSSGLECQSKQFQSNRNESTSSQDQQVEIYSLFVGNISYETPLKELQRVFRFYGEIQRLWWGFHYNSLKFNVQRRPPTRYAFVTFKKTEDAQKALAASGNGRALCLNGKKIKVNVAHWQPKRNSDGKMIWDKRVAQLEDERLRYTLKRREEQDALIDESKCRIHILDDDCLMHIFSYLPKCDLIRIEGVSKHWQALSREMWLSVKKLNFDWFPSPQSNFPSLTTNVLQSVLDRCGPNLRGLDVNHWHSDLDDKTFKTISDMCPKLEDLKLCRMKLSNDGLKLLYDICLNLKHFVMDTCQGLGRHHDDKILKKFFEHCPQLVTLHLTNNMLSVGDSISGLNGSELKELIVNDSLISGSWVQAFQRFGKLERLSMDCCSNLDSATVREMFKCMPQLSSLSMTRRFPLLRGSGLCAISELHNLVTLTLYQNEAVNDLVMGQVSTYCKKITHLDVSGCSTLMPDDTLTDIGIKAIMQLHYLTHLKMNYMGMLTDTSLEDIAEKGRLVSLEIRGCPLFTDFGCSRIATLCNELQLFDMSGCQTITSDTLAAAIASVKLRTNKTSLRLIVGGTAISLHPDDIDTDVPLLIIDKTNLSDETLRPDYVDDDVYFFSDDDDDMGSDEMDDDLDLFDWECQHMFLGEDFDEMVIGNLRLAVNYDYDDEDDDDDDD